MKPIRKDEIEYLSNYIDKKFQSRRSALESQREIEVDQTVDKNLAAFKSKLNVEKLLKNVVQLEKEYTDYRDNYDRKLTEIRNKALVAAEKLEKKLNNWKSIRNWKEQADIVNDKFDNKVSPVKLVDINCYIEERCKDETRKAYDASKKGSAIRLLDAQREESENALYSGGSIQAVRQYISGIFQKAGIQDSVAKNLLMLSEK